MEYYSSYQQDRCYAIDRHNHARCKEIVFTYTDEPVAFSVKEWDIDNHTEREYIENNLVFPYKPITCKKRRYPFSGNGDTRSLFHCGRI